MPYYTCGNGACPTGGQPFSLRGAGQKFCPRCSTPDSLAAAAPPVEAPTTQTRVITTSNQMDAVGGDDAAVDELIATWRWHSCSKDASPPSR